jgi:HEAT repeat protein
MECKLIPMLDDSINELFAETLNGDYDDDAPWEAVRDLRKLGSRAVFDRAAAWCGSEDRLKRARGADVLAQLGKGVGQPHSFPHESFAIISKMASHEIEPLPLASAIHALGHLGNAQAIETLVAHRSHANASVRFAVAAALGMFAEDPVAASTLVQLAGDPDDDVRDWATFAVGEFSGLDTPEVRELLIRNFADSSEEVRYEAMVGLAKRKDPRVLAALIETLGEPEVSSATVEAASAMLGQAEIPEWRPEDFITALREKFGLRFAKTGGAGRNRTDA